MEKIIFTRIQGQKVRNVDKKFGIFVGCYLEGARRRQPAVPPPGPFPVERPRLPQERLPRQPPEAPLSWASSRINLSGPIKQELHHSAHLL